MTAADPLAERPRWPALLAWALWALSLLALPVIAWLDHLSRKAGRPDLVQLAGASLPPVLGLVSAATVGAVVASRRPRHPVGWLLLVLALALNTGGVAAAYTAYGLLARPGALPAAGTVARYAPVLALTGLPALGFVLLLTPTGSPPSRRWRWWAWLTGAAPVSLAVTMALARGSLDPRVQAESSPLDFRGVGGPLWVVNQIALGITLLTVVIAAGSLLVRYRRARGVQRQQLRWVAWAAVLVALAAIAAPLASSALGLGDGAGLAAGICIALLPLAIGAAILRYRLYDLDRIISRTVAYTLVIGLLVLPYLLILPAVTRLAGDAGSLAVAAATLTAAMLYSTLSRWVHDRVDRRFNRRHYDAARTIATFSARLRQQVDLDTLTGELLGVVEQTMQPASVSLWLRPR